VTSAYKATEQVVGTPAGEGKSRSSNQVLGHCFLKVKRKTVDLQSNYIEQLFTDWEPQ
jgi:hypothetical protein